MAGEELGEYSEEFGPGAEQIARVATGLKGCLPASLVGVISLIAVVIWAIGEGDLFDGDKDETASTSCDAAAAEPGDLVLISFRQGCEPGDDTAASDEDETTDEPEPDGTVGVPPTPEELPSGAQLFEGTSGGELGCITCDGQSRFIHITNSTTAAGDAQRPAQEVVWPENGEIVDFGVTVSGPNRGRYGFNVFANGEYRNGCALEIVQTSCQMNQPPTPLLAGDRVTIIVGEGGITNEDGTPASVGVFVVDWYFVFQPG